MLGSALQLTTIAKMGPRIIFATPTGERHELGLQIAALVALGAGANPIYLGPELPVEDLIMSAETSGAKVLALSLVTIPPSQSHQLLKAIRGGLSGMVKIWIGGSGARELPPIEGITPINSLDDLEQRVLLIDK
jgi:methanogenic corrinoid protein MtbC1